MTSSRESRAPDNPAQPLKLGVGKDRDELAAIAIDAVRHVCPRASDVMLRIAPNDGRTPKNRDRPASAKPSLHEKTQLREGK